MKRPRRHPWYPSPYAVRRPAQRLKHIRPIPKPVSLILKPLPAPPSFIGSSRPLRSRTLAPSPTQARPPPISSCTRLRPRPPPLDILTGSMGRSRIHLVWLHRVPTFESIAESPDGALDTRQREDEPHHSHKPAPSVPSLAPSLQYRCHCPSPQTDPRSSSRAAGGTRRRAL